MRNFISVMSCVGLVLSLTACAQSEQSALSAKRPLEVSLAENYDSLEQIAQTADHTVLIKTVSATEIERDQVPFTYTKAQVLENITGNEIADEINIVQTGNAETYVEGLADILDLNQEYVLFLRPYGIPTPVEGESFVVVGVGAFAKTDSSEEFVLDEYSDPLVENFPSTIELNEVRELE